MNWLRFDCLESTNDYLKALARQNAADGTVVRADRQSRGHGQYGRVFESPEGGLYFSLLARFPSFDDGILSLTEGVGRVIQEIIRKEWGLETQIKLPNDILYEGRKLCGILCESYTEEGSINVVIGVGLNVNTKPEAFSQELSGIAASLYEITGETRSLDYILQITVTELTKLINNYK